MRILKKEKDKDFRILNITDTQMGAEQLDPENKDRQYLFETIRQLVFRVRPQLITISGDLSYGFDPKFIDILRCFFDFIESFDLPWAVIWGNHDNQGGKDNICKAVKLLEQYPHAIYEAGESSMGNGNYLIEIHEDNKVVEGLIMMDTHDRMSFTDKDGNESLEWAKLLPCQIKWYEKQVEILRDKGCNKSVLITHIPIYAYRKALSKALKSNIDEKAVLPCESNNPEIWNEGYKNSFGVNYECISSYPADEGAFDSILNSHSTKLVICGHDHINNWVIEYKGIKLAYSLKTGRGCYYNKNLNGGTVITIDDNGDAGIYHEYVNLDF